MKTTNPKFYITEPVKEALKKIQVTLQISLYELALKIGISETSLRFFLNGGGLSKKSYIKIVELLKEEEKTMTDDRFNEKMKQLEAFLHNVHLMCDTMQREVLYDCLTKAVEDIKSGNTISFNKLLFEIGV